MMAAKKLNLILTILYLISTPLLIIAQDISISNISVKKAFLNQNVEISGSGFNSNAASNEVWFGASKGSIVSASENLIIAGVPAGATVSAITVLNKTSGLSATSSTLFHPTYQGTLSQYDQEATTFANTKKLFGVTIVDIDNDGKNDVVASKNDNTATKLVVYRNVSTGSNIDFTQHEITVGSPTTKITFGDIDNDGKQDIAVSRGGGTSSQIYILRNTSTAGTISFAAPKGYYLRTTQFASSIKIRDLDLDGKQEVVVLNTVDNEISIFKNNSTVGTINLSITPTRIPFSTDGSDTGGDLVLEDLNNDGKHDIAINRFINSDIYILLNTSSTGSLTFDSPVIIPISGTLSSIVAGDINEDGKTDLAAVDPFSNKLWVIPNLSTSSVSVGAAQDFSTNDGSTSLALADFVGNGQLDIVITSNKVGEYTFFENTSSGGTLTLTKQAFVQSNYSIAVAAGDLSDDGKPDFVFTSQDDPVVPANFYLTTIRNKICVSPEILGEQSPTICNGQTHTFETADAPNATFIWKKDNVEVKNSADPFYDATAAGDYTVTVVTDAGACSTVSPIVTLALNTGAIPNDPVASNDGPSCLGGTISLSTVTVAGATYAWTGPNGWSSTEQNPTISNVTPEMAGTYTVTATVAPCNSNPSSTIVEVINPPDMAVSNNGSNRFCEGENVTLTVGAASDYSYQWFKDGTAITGATSNSFVASEAGSYTVNLNGSPNNNCDLTSEPIVLGTFSPPTPVFSLSGSLCTGSEITFTESTTVETDKTPTYSWNFGGGSPADNTPNPTHIYTTAGDYTVSLTMGYVGHTCANPPTTSTITISDPTAFTIAVTGSIPFCEGDSVLLEVPSTGFSSAVWSTGESGLSIYAITEGTISVEATNTVGCLSSDQVDITTLTGPTVSATSDLTQVSAGQSVQLEASGAVSYEWSPGETLSDSTIANPIGTPTITTLYVVIGTDANECWGTAEVNIQVDNSGDLPIEVPRMFSPNNDGIDDFWVISNIQNLTECHLIVFARNGQKVLERTNGYSNDWDGKDINSIDLPEGAYFYTITCQEGSTSGSVSIIR